MSNKFSFSILSVGVLLSGCLTAQEEIELVRDGYYSADLLGCHFPIPVSYELKPNPNTVLFTKEHYGTEPGGLPKNSFARIELIDRNDSEYVKSDHNFEQLLLSESVEVLRVTEIGIAMYIIFKGDEKIQILDRDMNDSTVLKMVTFCIRHPN